MLRKLALFKQLYFEGKEISSIQDDINLRKNIEHVVKDFFPTSNIKSAYANSGKDDGRSSFCFYKTLQDKTTFLKVNIPGHRNKIVLQKEYKIYSTLYKDVAIAFYDISDEIAILEMQYLEKHTSLLPEKAKWLIDCVSIKLSDIGKSGGG